MEKSFPRTIVGGISLSRMIIGTNWILGYSHKSQAADSNIRNMNGTKEAISLIMQEFLKEGIDTVMGLFKANTALQEGIKMAEDKTGKKIIIIDTPVINVDNNSEARRQAEENIKLSRKNGAAFCFPHHISAEQLVNKNTQTIDRLPHYLSMIRDNGMIPGVSAHMPELILYSDKNEYDVETYVQIYNCMGFLMQVEIEYINKIIWNAKKPVMTIKSMAAGRCTPFVGISFSFNTIRPQDMVTVGCLTPMEAVEDIEIAKAAIEHRRPNLEGRDSPGKSQSSILR